MLTIIRGALGAVVISLVTLSAAYANPIPPTKTQSAGVLALFIVALAAEVSVTLFLLKKYNLRINRMWPVYFLFNLVSFVLFRTLLLRTFPVFVAECMVILLETAGLFMLINLDWFRRGDTKEVPLMRTLVAVTIGNVTSVLLGTFVLLPALLATLRFVR